MVENLVTETNNRLSEIINELKDLRTEYEKKLDDNNHEIESQLAEVQKYKDDFFEAKAKIEKMNADIEGFETDYKNLVDRFKDDELANILVAANKEISLKIDERKRKILQDKNAMNELVDKAESVKATLVELTAEKKKLEAKVNKITDAYEYYSKAITDIMNYANANRNNLSNSFNNGINYSDTEIDIDQKTQTIYDYDSDNGNLDLFNDNQEEDKDDTNYVEAVDLSDMIKDDFEEDTNISDYDNEDVIEGDEHKIIVDNHPEIDDTFYNKKKKKKKNKHNNYTYNENNSEAKFINIDYDDALDD